MKLNPFFQRLTTDIPLLAGGSEVMLLQTLDVDNPLLAEHPALKGMKAELKPKMTMHGEFGVIPVQGLLATKPTFWEMVSGRVEDTAALTELVSDAGRNSDVRGVLLSVDSPGGFFMGGPELADAVAALAARKPVVAHISGMGASLAYMVASQASAVVASRSALVGSIGTYNVHADFTRMMENAGIKLEVFRNTEGTLKAPGAMGTALTETQRAHIQAQTDRVNGVFVELVKAKRPNVAAESMRGQVFIGKEAQAAGLADFVGSQEQAIGLLKRLTA